jgi:hypothetical protein
MGDPMKHVPGGLLPFLLDVALIFVAFVLGVLVGFGVR